MSVLQRIKLSFLVLLRGLPGGDPPDSDNVQQGWDLSVALQGLDERLTAVEKQTEATRKQVYRVGKTEAAEAEIVPVPPPPETQRYPNWYLDSPRQESAG